MKPFLPNKQQLEAIANVATKLWIPMPPHPSSYVVRLKDSPLQPNEQYFVQEDFTLFNSNVQYRTGSNIDGMFNWQSR